jgi:hypothetical protein
LNCFAAASVKEAREFGAGGALLDSQFFERRPGETRHPDTETRDRINLSRQHEIASSASVCGAIAGFSGMTRVLQELRDEGVDITPEILAGFAPFRTAHINRFGDYTLDFRRKIGPLNFATTIIPMES